MHKNLHTHIESLLKSQGVEGSSFVVSRTEDSAHGDYATNVALSAGKRLKKNPKVFAEELASELRKNLPEGVEKVEVAGPGFINLFLSRDYFAANVREVLEKKDAYGTNSILKGEKVIVEYTDPNPFKEFHIGHLMSNAIGESISRLIQFSGAEVKRACYQGDVGMHVAKAIWGMQSMPQRDASPLEKLSLEAQAKYLGHAYSLGAAAYDDGYKEEVALINQKVYDRSDVEVNKLYDWGRKISLEYFQKIYDRLGTKFDFFFFESDTAPKGKVVVEAGLAKGIFEKSDGAVVFHAELHDPKLHTRVFVNSQGIPTYEAKDLGLALAKKELWEYDRSIIITGNEVNDYFKVLLMAMKLLYPELAAKTLHLSHGMLRLSSGKMSSRKGDVVTAESLLSDISKWIEQKIRDREYDDVLRSAIVETVSIGALKYSILHQAIGGDIVFDFEKSISFEGDSGPYLQYSATRAKSVLEKAEEAGIVPSIKKPTKSVAQFERLLAYFPGIVARASSERAPHLVLSYLIELAGSFNAFYAQEKIIDAQDMDSPYRLALVQAFRTVMENGLWLVGIRIPSKM